MQLPTDELTPEASGLYSRLVLDYLSGDESLKHLYRWPHQADTLDALPLHRTVIPSSRAQLVEVLQRQYAKLRLAKDSPVTRNLSLLAHPDTYTVTTGHQLCLFSGPLYVLIKILHTVKLAEMLTARNPGKHIVPVFWMASEDHDLAEIASVTIRGQKVTWGMPDAHDATGRYTTQGIDAFINAVHQVFGNEQVPEIIKPLSVIYRTSATIAEATFRMMHLLFEQYGLIVIDPDDHILKTTLQPVMQADIMHQVSLPALDATNQWLRDHKFTVQVTGRPVNFFYFHEGQRVLIHPHANGFTIGDTALHLSREQMELEIAQHPERFSPNVVLRPVYQELILPNLVYVGGPGEVSYWLQLKQVFEVHQTPFPMVNLRNSVVVFNPYMNRLRTRLNLPDALLFGRPEDMRVAALSKFRPTNEAGTAALIDAAIQALIDETEPLDNTLSATLVHRKKEWDDFFTHYAAKLRKSKSALERKRLDELEQLRQWCMPGQAPAERVNNILHYLAGNDHEAFLNQLYQHLDPMAPSIKRMTF